MKTAAIFLCGTYKNVEMMRDYINQKSLIDN